MRGHAAIGAQYNSISLTYSQHSRWSPNRWQTWKINISHHLQECSPSLLFPSSLSPPIHPLSLPPHQQNQRMMTPSAASDTVSSPPCSGYIHSQNPLIVHVCVMCMCVWRGKWGLDEYLVCEFEHGTCKARLTAVLHWPQNMRETYAGFTSSPSSAPSPW